MKLLIYFLAFVTCSLSQAAPLEFRMYSADKKTYQTIQVTEFNGVKISASCIKNGKANCNAWNAVQNKVALSPSGARVVGNPAAHYCLAQKSNNRIFLDQKNREYDYCVFSDGSAIDSWTLYNKHYGDK